MFHESSHLRYFQRGPLEAFIEFWVRNIAEDTQFKEFSTQLRQIRQGLATDTVVPSPQQQQQVKPSWSKAKRRQ